MKRETIKKRPLSDTTLANLESEEKDYREKDSEGLYFFVQKNGKKSWQLRYKNENDKWSWKGLGAYPKVSGQYARKKANELKLVLADGGVLETINNRNDKKTVLTFGFLIEEWLDIQVTKWTSSETGRKARLSVRKHLITNFGHKDCTKITKKEWFDFFQYLRRAKNINNQVDKLISYCTNAYDLAIVKGQIENNPLARISKHLDHYEKGNMKYVDLAELPTLVQDVRSYRSRTMVIAIELAVMLFPRPSELRCATWDQFDLKKKLWNRPAEIMKGRIAHTIPLPKQAIILVKELEDYRTESPFLFPARGTYSKPVSDGTFNTVLKRCGYQGRQTVHGFRHIASTALNDQFSDKEQVIEACLAHKKKGVKAVYDKSNHLEERMKIMQWWADYLESVT